MIIINIGMNCWVPDGFAVVGERLRFYSVGVVLEGVLSKERCENVKMSGIRFSESVEIVRFHSSDGNTYRVEDVVSAEQPLEIRVRGQSVAITMRTPGHDRELAAGFAISEGLIKEPSQLLEVDHCRRGEAEHPENIVNLYLDAATPWDLEKLSRHVFASSSCGICGKASLEAIRSLWPPVRSDFRIGTAQVLSLPRQLWRAQAEFQRTGGLHAAALFDLDGRIVCVREDVGRHNAVDKIIGWSFLNGCFPLESRLLLVSGRASFEIMQKALAGRVSFVAAVSAPSSLAVEFAKENGQTLVGFLRPDGFNVYSNPERIQASSSFS